MFYTGKRTRNLYSPSQTAPFRLSRSKIELFIECPLCFYLDRRMGVPRPPSFPFHLNSAVDLLLKKEFDMYRHHRTPHPLMVAAHIDAIPFSHEKLDEWRENFKGIEFTHEKTNFRITGAVDDIWQLKTGELVIVDYKATSKEGAVSIDAPWQGSYKRQMEIYQWLFRKNGFEVHDTGYFVYCNGIRDRESFDYKLLFNISMIPYSGRDVWVDPLLTEIHKTLLQDTPPPPSKTCPYCLYRETVLKEEKALS